jgi:hypothetical protein
MNFAFLTSLLAVFQERVKRELILCCILVEIKVSQTVINFREI